MEQCGNGEADDTEAIQAAIDHANSCGYNRQIFLQKKEYLISKSIVLNGCSIIGTPGNIYNIAGSVIKCKTKDFTAIKQGSTDSKDIMFNISDVLVKSAAIGFELNYVINSKFERLYADDCETGFKLGDSESVGSMFNEFNNFYTKNCEIGIESISSQYFNNNVFNNGYIQGNRYAMNLKVVGGYGAVNNVFNNVEFKSSNGRGIILTSATNTLFNSCYFENGGNSIRMTNYCTITLNNCVYGLYKENNNNNDNNMIYAEGGGVITIDNGMIFLTAENQNKVFFGAANEAIYQNITILKAISKNGNATGFIFFEKNVKEYQLKQQEQALSTGTFVAAGNAYTIKEFTYNEEFDAIPEVVVLTPRGAENIANGLFYMLSEKTKTGGKISIYNATGSDRSINISIYAKKL